MSTAVRLVKPVHKGYSIVLHCEREGPEGTIDELLFEEIKAVQRSIALQQKTLSTLVEKIEQLLAQHKPRPSIAEGYR